jgi:hypothetical protein
MALQEINFANKKSRQNFIRVHSSFVKLFVGALFEKAQPLPGHIRIACSIPKMGIYSSYIHYCKHYKIQPLCRQTFGKYFTMHSQAKTNTSTATKGKVYLGIKWRHGDSVCPNPTDGEFNSACECDPCVVRIYLE